MVGKERFCTYEPLSKEFAELSKIFYGVVSNKLQGLEIDRYYYTLVLIKEGNGKITQKDLSGQICSDKVFVVKILDYLSDKGMVKRQINEKDRREHFIMITPKGEKLIPVIAKAFNEANDIAFKGLTKNEQSFFYKALCLMKENLASVPSDEMKINFKRVKK